MSHMGAAVRGRCAHLLSPGSGRSWRWAPQQNTKGFHVGKGVQGNCAEEDLGLVLPFLVIRKTESAGAAGWCNPGSRGEEPACETPRFSPLDWLFSLNVPSSSRYVFV